MNNANNKNYLAPFIAIFIVSSLILTIFSVSISYYNLLKVNQDISKTNLENEVNKKIEDFKILFNQKKEALNSISQSEIFKDYIKNDNNTYTNDMLFSIIKSNNNIMQLRYIDEKGNEKIRFDRDKIYSSNVYKIKEEKLQNKANRYYFKETIKKNKNEYYISRLDLNIENQKIEIPLVPVIRIATPIFDENNEKKGILIINVFMEYFLNKLIQSELFNVYVFDDEYNSIYTSDENFKNFEKYLSDNSNNMLKNKSFNKKLLLQNSDEEIFIALQAKDFANLEEHIYKILVDILIIIIPISILLAYIISRIPNKLLKEIKEDHNVMINQSKQNAISEMIVMIAHQWRQPLTVISLIAQEIIFAHKLDMLDKKTSDKLGSQLLNKIELLSKSIDDFRDIFRDDNNKIEFDILKSVKEIKQMMLSNLEEVGINLNIDYKADNKLEEPFKITSYKTKFNQVLLNLISNSIKAIEENSNLKDLREINIFIKRLENSIELSIQDTGKGIKEEELNKIFELYYSSNKEILQGKGLGLYFVKNIVDTKFNGSITVKNVKQGAKFTIRIPL